MTAGLADAGALVVALDGKTVRGARAKDGKAPHLLVAMICGARAVLAQKDVDAKTNEITQVGALLDELDIAGACGSARRSAWMMGDFDPAAGILTVRHGKFDGKGPCRQACVR